MSNGSVIVAPSNSTFFTNANQYDFLFYTASNSQKLLFGVNSNAPASLTFSSNLCAINGNIAINNTLAVNGLSIAMNNGTMANITTSSVAGFSNTTNGVQISMKSNTSNNAIVFTGSNTTLATLTGTANLYVGSNILPGYSNYPVDLTGNSGNIVTSGNICAGNLGMFRNRIINGDMRINQRGATSYKMTNNNPTYMPDRFISCSSGTGGQLTQSILTLTSSDAPYSYGIRYSFKNIISTAVTAINTSYIRQCIEGYNISDFMWGTTVGTSVTVSFWSRSQGVTNLAVSLVNNANNYTYNMNVAVSQNSVWQYNTLTIPAPPYVSVWDNTSNIGISLNIGGYQPAYNGIASTTGWVSGCCIGTTSTTNWAATVGNYVEVTGVQLEKGTLATPFEFRPYAIELAMCQRYCFRIISPTAYGRICNMIDSYCHIYTPVPLVNPVSSANQITMSASTLNIYPSSSSTSTVVVQTTAQTTTCVEFAFSSISSATGAGGFLLANTVGAWLQVSVEF